MQLTKMSKFQIFLFVFRGTTFTILFAHSKMSIKRFIKEINKNYRLWFGKTKKSRKSVKTTGWSVVLPNYVHNIQVGYK